MAVIGNIHSVDNGNKTILVLDKIPHLPTEQYLIANNEEKKNINSPDKLIFLKRKDSKASAAVVGGIWIKDAKESSIRYWSCSINSPIFPNGVLNFSCFPVGADTVQPDNLEITHNALWSMQKAPSEDIAGQYDIPSQEDIANAEAITKV